MKLRKKLLLLCLLGAATHAGHAATDSEAQVVLKGPLVQGGLVIGKVAPGSRVDFGGRNIRVSKGGHFLLGFSRDAKPRAELKIVFPDGTKKSKTLHVRKREYDVQRIDGLPPKQVSPSKKDLERIRKEQALINAARRRDDPRTDFLQSFIWPVTGRISGVYGSQRILNGQARRPHAGVDIAAPSGTPVRAPAAGVVSLVHESMYFTGRTLILDHGHGLSTLYTHLSKIHVEPEQRVAQGEVIAEVGMTGRATGPHLHWGMNLFSRKLDPKLLLDGNAPDSASAAGTSMR